MFLALIKKLHMFGSWKEWKEEELEDCSQHDIKYKTRRMNYKLARENFDKIFKSVGVWWEINLSSLPASYTFPVK